MVKCLVDNSLHEDLEQMHKHLRKLKIKQEDYYTKYYPKKSLATGNPIIFKNYKQYLDSEFNSKDEAKIYFNVLDTAHHQKACQWLEKRAKDKKLENIPSWIELKTASGPDDEIFDMFYWPSINLNNRFPKKYLPSKANEIRSIIVDTREQTPWSFENIKVINRKLDFGDYHSPDNKNIYIERKAFMDGISTFTTGLERFKREVERAKKHDAYLFVIFEKNFDAYCKWDDYRLSKRYVKTNPEHFFKGIREVMEEFDNVQCVFANSPKDAKELAIHIMESDYYTISRVDLQKVLYKGATWR